ncbi:enoyl-CoA hydratase/isomerase family protein [Bacillus testis]|uniref:enoyl-CoA hydratase/isomerase family protein n=1 Tax=Bacillus testis TaxID=1622072 RepID=UPI00067EA74B|nr:enoyl-CoA hydratase/isomerase family protein [Bacillus testis]
MKEAPAVLLDREGSIAVITLNRPDKLNSFSAEMRDQLYEAIQVIRDDPTMEGAILHGNGRGFCAGADLTEFGTEPSVLTKRQIRLRVDLWEELRRLPKPIAACLHGFAVGSGLEMAMLCDFRFAAPGTRLALPEAQLGMVPAAGGTQSLPRLVLEGHAMEMMLTGKQINAEEGCRLRIIHKIVPKENLLSNALRFMDQLTEKKAQTAQWTKTLVAHGMDLSLSDALAKERAVVGRSWAAKR